MTKHVRLPVYDAVDLDKLSYSNGDVVADITNGTIRLMDGNMPGGAKLATQSWVRENALTDSTLNSAIATQLTGYVPLTTLAAYSTTSQMNTAISTAVAGVSFTYTLPTAGTGSGGTLGGVKVDGTTITISNGIISGANTYVLPKAQAATGGNILGGVIPDGTTITINPATGVITGAQLYTLPAATTNALGGVKVPDVSASGLTNSSGTIGLATASNTQIGGVKVDNTTITINSGIISAPQYTLPAANTSTLGGVIVPVTANSGLTNTSGTIRLVQATTTQLGGVKVDGTTITIAAGGQISAVFAGAITFVGAWSAAANNPALANGAGTNGNEYICSAAGTVNFGAGNITFAVGDAVIYNGTLNQWIRIPASSALASLTFATTGGASSGTSYSGTSPVTIDYSTLGASPLAGSSSLTTVGTIASGTWNGGIIGPTYGGTGVNNGASTITIGGNLTLSGAYSTTITATASTSVTLPTSGTIISSVTALNSAVTGTPNSSTFLRGDGTWSAPAGGGTVTSVGGTGTVNGLTLTGTVTSSGNLTLGGTLSLATAPAIGTTSAAAGNFTTIGATTQGTGQFTSLTATSVNLGQAGSVITNIASTNYISLNSNNGQMFSDGNFHIHSGSGSIWINTLDSSPIKIGTQSNSGTGASIMLQGQFFGTQASPTVLSTAGANTLTIAQILTNIITVTQTAAVTLTLPTGTLTDAGIISGGLNANNYVDWYVINLGTGSGAITIAAGTTHTYIGSTAVAIGTTAQFRTRKISSNSFTTYRLG